MEQEQKSTVDFLNNITPDEVFKEESDDREISDSEEKEEKPLPFHEDPKIQKYIQKEVAKRFEAVRPPSEEQRFKKEVEEEINLPSSFVRLVGNDTDEKKQVLKDLSNYFSTLKGEARQEFLEEMRQQEEQAAAQDQAALDELNSGFEAIEEEFGVDLNKDTNTRTAFIEFLRKASHKNADGEVDQFADIPSTWELFQERQTNKPASRAKELASRGMTRSGETSSASSGFKSGTRDPWQQVEQHFSKLKNLN